MANGKCRMHGGRSGGPTGSRNGAWRHGRYTQEAKAMSAWARGLARDIDVFGAVTITKCAGLRSVNLRAPAARHL
jgi:hypothetical protein